MMNNQAYNVQTPSDAGKPIPLRTRKAQSDRVLRRSAATPMQPTRTKSIITPKGNDKR